MALITEIAPNVHRISILYREINLQFNHFLVVDDEPLLYPKFRCSATRTALALVPGSVEGESRDYICSTSRMVRSRWGRWSPRRWSRIFWALSGVVTQRTRTLCS